MTEEIEDKTPEELLREVVSELEAGTEPPFIVVTNERGLTLKAKEGHILLAYHFGDAAVAPILDAFGLAEYLRDMCAAVLDDYLKTAAIKRGRKRAKLSEVYPDEESRSEILQGLTGLALHAYLHELPNHLIQSLVRHEQSVRLFTLGTVVSMFAELIAEPGTTLTTPLDVRQEADSLVKEFRAEEARYLFGTLERIEGKPSFDRLDEHYQRLKGKYQDARAVYKRNRDSAKWRDIVALEVPEAAQFPDLLTRLANRPELLTDELRGDVLRTGASGAASHLAIEHAARLCGFQDYTYAVSVLFRKRKGQDAEQEPEAAPDEVEGVQ